jgi:hypothetical protein
MRSGEKISALTGSLTTASPNDGRPASWANSPRNDPGPNV